MEALEWAWVGLMSVAWLLLFHAVRERVVLKHPRRRPPTASLEPAITRRRRLWLDHKPPTV
jgi:hypothetical protein